jgi:hypothetical protein
VRTALLNVPGSRERWNAATAPPLVDEVTTVCCVSLRAGPAHEPNERRRFRGRRFCRSKTANRLFSRQLAPFVPRFDGLAVQVCDFRKGWNVNGRRCEILRIHAELLSIARADQGPG